MVNLAKKMLHGEHRKYLPACHECGSTHVLTEYDGCTRKRKPTHGTRRKMLAIDAALEEKRLERELEGIYG